MLPLILRTAATAASVGKALLQNPAASQTASKALMAVPIALEGVGAALGMSSARARDRSEADEAYDYTEDTKLDSKARDGRDETKAGKAKTKISDADKYQKGWDAATKND